MESGVLFRQNPAMAGAKRRSWVAEFPAQVQLSKPVPRAGLQPVSFLLTGCNGCCLHPVEKNVVLRWPSLRRPLDVLFLVTSLALTVYVLVPEIWGNSKTKDY